jgi:hypothetical protein
MLALLGRHHAGERVWSVLREPTPEHEDARTHRELAWLSQERIAHTNRIRSLPLLQRRIEFPLAATCLLRFTSARTNEG